MAPSATATKTASPTVPESAPAAACTTQNLRWTLTRITDPATGVRDPANAELVAVNAGSLSCTLVGYPKLEFHVGKGPQAVGVGKGRPAAVTLEAGKGAVIALSYSELNGKGPDSGACVSVTAGAADVAAPGDGTTVRVPVVDQRGRPAQVTICGDEVHMSPPVARQ
ncbi:hypothetical protein GCM10009665_27050 [Kitasatospora nipponensis]|uniref:DUF4232 domain-containing protein n=1 Tax=Kitasatospora nipponensis TaxID=258049 RepID=A0ABN1W6X7_9ACTN